MIPRLRCHDRVPHFTTTIYGCGNITDGYDYDPYTGSFNGNELVEYWMEDWEDLV
jgi:hypothetical protein